MMTDGCLCVWTSGQHAAAYKTKCLVCQHICPAHRKTVLKQQEEPLAMSHTHTHTDRWCKITKLPYKPHSVWGWEGICKPEFISYLVFQNSKLISTSPGVQPTKEHKKTPWYVSLNIKNSASHPLSRLNRLCNCLVWGDKFLRATFQINCATNGRMKKDFRN